MQVAQGIDTDCFAEIVGSLLGAFHGPGNLEDRWLTPFNDEICTSVAGFYERSLSAVAARMGRLAHAVLKDQ
jgi:ADP-ribosylglycohydrolase